MKYILDYKNYESVNVDREYYYPKFTEEFVSNIKDMSLELSDSGCSINIVEVKYQRWQDDKSYESLSVDIDSEGNFIDYDILEQTINSVKSIADEQNMNVDIEIVSEDEYITSEEFIENYGGEELSKVSIIIW
jgi:hypothetical protein